MKVRFKKSILEMVRLLLAFIFILAAIEKIKNPYAFALSIDAYQIFPSLLINLFTLIIPWLELFIGFGLIFKYKLKANLFLYLILMMSFTILVFVAIGKGLDIECGCFGENSGKVGLSKIIENTLLIIANIYLIRNNSLLKEF